MHGIKIPQQEFVLKMQGGGGILAEYYGIRYLYILYPIKSLVFEQQKSVAFNFLATN